MTYLFQGLFKDFWGTFSRSFQGLFFALSNIHSRKNDHQCTFQIRHTETIWSWVRQKNGGRGFGYVFLTILDYLLYYGYNTVSNNSAWKGGLGVLPQKNIIRISTKSCNSRGYYVTIRVETAHFETDWYIETHNINTCRYSWDRKDMIAIVLELYMSKRNWKIFNL